MNKTTVETKCKEKANYRCDKCGEEFRLASSLWIHQHQKKCPEDTPLVSFKS